MQYEIPGSLTAQVRKSPITVNGIDTWPTVSIAKVFEYGFQQLMNDAAAPAKSPAEIPALVQKRIDNLANGVLRASPIRTGDPVAREALRIATEHVNAAIKKADKEADAATVRKLANALIAKDSSITDVARANVERTSGLDIEVDLTNL